tara:strand:+ start:949 stop:1689 length:741 start_codon:yes stop_codon:yes gene_type:complete
MKKIIVLMVLIGLPISLIAQEVPDPLTAGYSQCKFLPGKGMESLEEYIELFNEELDKAGIEMSSAMLMPFFKTNISEYDVLWVNTWEDNTKAGKAMDWWLSDAGEKSRDAWPMFCDTQVLTYQWWMEMVTDRDDFEGQNFSASYYTCNLSDGKNLGDAYLASNAELKLAHSKGSKSSSALIRPASGTNVGEFPFDFVRLYTNPSFQNWGEAVDGWYDDVRGTAESNKVRDAYDCNGSTLFTGRIVR